MNIVLTVIGAYVAIGVIITVSILLYDRFSVSTHLWGNCLNEKYYNGKFLNKCGYLLLMVLALPVATIISIPIITKELIEIQKIKKRGI